MFVRVNQRVHNAGREAEILIFLEVDQPSMKALFDDFSRTGTIYGMRYEARKDRESQTPTWVTHDEYETIIKDGIVSISEMRGELIDSDGYVLWPLADEGEAA